MSRPIVLAALAALMASAGAYLICVPPRTASGARRALYSRLRDWSARSGLDGMRPAESIGAAAAFFVAAALGAYVLFGGLLPAVVAGCFAATAPVSSYRTRKGGRRAAARDAWPRMLEELRLLVGAGGVAIPQALFQVGRRAPPDMRAAFAASEREWLLTTDFRRTVELLKARLDDPTADTVCETLAVAHELGGAGVTARLQDLIDDRVLELEGRRDAVSRQAGVRFARRFVLLVPLGMALVGLSIGSGRAAYETAGGQVAVVVGLLAVVVCWAWSARLMRLPDEPRVFR